MSYYKQEAFKVLEKYKEKILVEDLEFRYDGSEVWEVLEAISFKAFKPIVFLSEKADEKQIKQACKVLKAVKTFDGTKQLSNPELDFNWEIGTLQLRGTAKVFRYVKNQVFFDWEITEHDSAGNIVFNAKYRPVGCKKESLDIEEVLDKGLKWLSNQKTNLDFLKRFSNKNKGGENA